MTRDDLAHALDHLDPGTTLRMEEGALAALFGSEVLSTETFQAVEAFAVEHSCSFSCHEEGRVGPCFEKNDIF